MVAVGAKSFATTYAYDLNNCLLTEAIWWYTGGFAGGLSSLASGGNFSKGFANGFLSGTITGAITGAVSAGFGQIAIFGKTLEAGSAFARVGNIAFQSSGNAAISFTGTAVQGFQREASLCKTRKYRQGSAWLVGDLVRFLARQNILV